MDLDILRSTYFLIFERRELTLPSLMERSLIWHCQLKFASIFTRWYLTFSVGYSLLPHNFIFKSIPNFFCLDLKIFVSVNFPLSELLFIFNQLTRCFKSALISLFSFWIELLKHKRLASSAKWWALENFIAWLRLVLYNRSIRGPAIDPWGRPLFITAWPDSYPCSYIYRLRLDWYYLNQSFENLRIP